MLHLCYSNRLEALCAPLAARVRGAQQQDPLTPVQILVPNPAVEQFLRFEIAEHNGVAANLEVGLIRRFLGTLIERADPTIQIIDKTRLQLVLYSRLQSASFVRRNKLDSIQSYLDHANSEEERQRRVFLLSGELARLLEEYGYSRRFLLNTWAEGRTATRDHWLDTERWQRRLWRALFDDDRTLRREGAQDPRQGVQPGLFGASEKAQTKHMMLMDAYESVRSKIQPPESLHIFGVSYVSTAFAEVFARLAQQTELYVYAQNPCMEFWEDVRTSGLGNLRADWARRSDPYDMQEQGDDPFDLENYADTPALRLWARPGREYIRLLNALSHCEFAPGFIDPTANSQTLLTQVQRDILLRAPEDELRQDLRADGSIQLIACPSLHREVEEIADQVWTMVRDSELEDERPLRFHEIAVFVTDGERDRYLAHIADVFASRDGIPFRVLDQNLSHGSGILDAVRLLLTVLSGRFERSKVMELLLHPNFSGPPMMERDRWSHWVSDLGVAWGQGPADFEGTYLEGERYHWGSVIERLLLGQYCAKSRDDDEQPSHIGSRKVFPFGTPSEVRLSVGALLESIRDLSTDARASQRATMSLADWSDFLLRAVSRYLQPDGPADESCLAQCLRAIDKMRDRDIEEHTLSFAVTHELLVNELKQLESKRSQHRADGVVISSLLPMRAIPFKAVFILGLGEGQFPAREVPDPLDLRQERRCVGDVSNAERDRYIFLETLIATRARLTLSWVARNETNGEPLEPSPIVRELEYVLRPYLSESERLALTRRPPIRSFEDKSSARPSEQSLYLQALETLWSEAPASIQNGGTRSIRAALVDDQSALSEQVFGLGPPRGSSSAVPRKRVHLNLLASFLSSPLQGSAQREFGIYDRRDRPTVSDNEPMAIASRFERELLERAFWSLGDDAAEVTHEYRRVFAEAKLLGKTPAGLFGEAALATGTEILEAWFQNASEMGLTPLTQWKRVAIGPSAEDTFVDHRIPPIELSIGDGLSKVLHGVAVHMHPERHAMMRCVSSKKATASHYLHAFISLVALSAAGARFPEVVRVFVNTTDAETPTSYKDYRVPPQSICKDWLIRITEDLCSGFQPYRLPIDVVMQWFKRRQQFPDSAPYLAPNARTADDRGPISDLSGFELPAIDTADQIVERRFDLWFKAGHR